MNKIKGVLTKTMKNNKFGRGLIKIVKNKILSQLYLLQIPFIIYYS